MSTTPTLRDAAKALLDQWDSEDGSICLHEVNDRWEALRAALTQGAGAVEPVAPYYFRRFVRGQERAEDVLVEKAATLDEAIKTAACICPAEAMTVLVLAPTPAWATPAQQLQQAVAREREECAAICERAVDSIWEYHEDNHKRTGRNVCTNLAAAIRAKGTHD